MEKCHFKKNLSLNILAPKSNSIKVIKATRSSKKNRYKIIKALKKTSEILVISLFTIRIKIVII